MKSEVDEWVNRGKTGDTSIILVGKLDGRIILKWVFNKM
jgi:hypothetical protein